MESGMGARKGGQPLAWLMDLLPVVEVRLRLPAAVERRRAQRQAFAAEVRTVLLDLGVGEPWRELCALMARRED